MTSSPTAWAIVSFIHLPAPGRVKPGIHSRDNFTTRVRRDAVVLVARAEILGEPDADADQTSVQLRASRTVFSEVLPMKSNNTVAAIAGREFKNDGRQFKAAGDTSENIASLVDAVTARDDEIKRFAGDTVKSQAETNARLLEVEQKLARRGGAPMATDAKGVDEQGETVPGVRMLRKSDLASKGKIAACMGVDDGEAWNADAGNVKLGDFMRAVAGIKGPTGVKALVEGTNASGGYAVPSPLLPGILAALAPSSSLLSSGANLVLLDETVGKSFSVAGVSAIPTAAWRLENGAVAESDPAFNALTITPRSLSFQFKVSRELLADAPGLELALNIAIGQAFAKEMDRAGLRGSGTAPEIRGLLNTTGVHAIGSGTNGAALANYTKFINARRAILTSNAPAPTAAIMSLRDDETMALFSDTTGQPLRRPDALASWQFETTSQIPENLTVGTSDDCSEVYVGDFTQFNFYLREGLSIQVASELYAGTGQVGFICHMRVDVAAIYPAAFAIITGVRAPA